MGRWLARDSVEELGGIALYVFCVNNAISYYDSTGTLLPALIPIGAAIARYIAQEIARVAIAAAVTAVTISIVDDMSRSRCPEPECLPCEPPVGTIGYRTDIVPPSKPHYPHTGTHTHLYVVNQSPIVRGCKCFWRPVTSIDGDVPPREAVPMNGSPAGGGVTFK
jgi:hypothetical protein